MNLKHSGQSPRRFVHEMAFGAQLTPSGVLFRLWAPDCENVGLEIDGTDTSLPMQSVGGGWHELLTAEARGGTRYRYVLPDGVRVSDPASRFQPEDVSGPSQVVDPASYAWRNGDWQGRPWGQAVVYELHLGAFTEQGTFRSAIEKLDHLAGLGVTALQIMPVGDFAGRRNWGYDGVLIYAPDSSYGEPDDFKALIDAAHDRGMMVLLDVIYNHFGPDGNYLSLYAAHFHTDRHHTPWGAAINYDGAHSAPIRQFVIQNALYWLHEYQLDGLRLDAVHAIIDDSDQHLLVELSAAVQAQARGRQVHLVLENEHNSAQMLARVESGTARHYTAQWNDDVHHVLHVAATGEGESYYGDYVGDTHKLGRALAEGFAFQGETMQCSGKARGQPSGSLPPQAFVAFIQNHDQVGNRAFGDRIHMVGAAPARRAVAAVYLLLPQVPMLFMGEEWNASTPFPFFCDFSGDLARAVSEGRRKEFAAFPQFQDPAKQEAIPDPQAESTFQSAKLKWAETGDPEHAAWLDWYRRILRVRAETIRPLVEQISRGGDYEVVAPNAVRVRWRAERGDLLLEANLSPESLREPLTPDGCEIWFEGTDRGHWGAWTVRWSLVPRDALT